jgi:hypothetical protein
MALWQVLADDGRRVAGGPAGQNRKSSMPLR